jgi:putative ABC transport system permease protein
MHIEDIFRLSLSNILHRKLRSGLTILGIAVGVAAVIALVSVGQGFQASISLQLSSLGGNLIFISPGNPRASGGFVFGGGAQGFGTSPTFVSLKEDDIRAIKTVPGVQYVTGIISHSAEIEFAGQKAVISVQGIEPGIWELVQITDLETGRYLRQDDSAGVVLGNRIANSFFDKKISLNSPIKINGKIFRVVGILKSTGGIIGGITDNIIAITKNTARNLFSNEIDSNEVSGILIKITETADPNIVANQIEQKLRIAHHVTEQNQDFTVNTPQIIQERIGRISSTITLFLGGIAAISILVGGIGIANTMFTSVMERTRQIGVLKSIGMTNGEVMKLILIESMLIGLIGGVIGTILGFFVSQGISQVGSFGPPTGPFRGQVISTYISPELVVFAIAFSGLIGGLSGLFPARRAANLQPVDALRYE